MNATTLLLCLTGASAAAASTSCAARAPAAAAPTAPAVVSASNLQWAPQAPGVPMLRAVLWGDPDVPPMGVLIKVPGGFVSPLHSHSADYRAVVVSGTLIHITDDGTGVQTGADKELTAGSYMVQPGHGLHIDKCNQGADCVLFEYWEHKQDILLPTKK